MVCFPCFLNQSRSEPSESFPTQELDSSLQMVPIVCRYEGSALQSTLSLFVLLSPCSVVVIPDAPKFSFSIVSATTMDRLAFLPSLLERWEGEFSIAVKVKNRDERKASNLVKSLNLPDRVRIILYIVSSRSSEATDFPVNKLRNIAIVNIVTTHFLVLDMDMWPARSFWIAFLSLSEFVSRAEEDSRSDSELDDVRDDRACVLFETRLCLVTLHDDLIVCSRERKAVPCKQKETPPLPCERQLFVAKTKDNHTRREISERNKA